MSKSETNIRGKCGGVWYEKGGGDTSSAKLGERHELSMLRQTLSPYVGSESPVTITRKSSHEKSSSVHTGRLKLLNRDAVQFEDGQVVRLVDIERVG